jgi:hypothetical protein
MFVVGFFLHTKGNNSSPQQSIDSNVFARLLQKNPVSSRVTGPVLENV